MSLRIIHHFSFDSRFLYRFAVDVVGMFLVGGLARGTETSPCSSSYPEGQTTQEVKNLSNPILVFVFLSYFCSVQQRLNSDEN